MTLHGENELEGITRAALLAHPAQWPLHVRFLPGGPVGAAREC